MSSSTPKKKPEVKEKKLRDEWDKIHKAKTETRRQELIGESVPVAKPIVRIIDAYADESLPGKESNLHIMAKEIFKRCNLAEYKRSIEVIAQIPEFRFNPLNIILDSDSKQATPQSKFEFVKFLLKNGYGNPFFLNFLSPHGHRTVLMSAAQQGNDSVVEELLNYGADIIYPREDRRQPNINLKAVDYAMHQLRSRPESKNEASPFLDYEKCAKLLMQQSFCMDENTHKETQKCVRLSRPKKPTHPRTYAMTECFLSLGFEDVDKAIQVKTPLVEFFVQQLAKAKTACEKRHSLFPEDREGIEHIDALQRKIMEQKASLQGVYAFYDFIERELKENPKLALYNQAKPSGPLAQAMFIAQIYARFHTIRLVHERDEKLDSRTKPSRPGS